MHPVGLKPYLHSKPRRRSRSDRGSRGLIPLEVPKPAYKPGSVTAQECAMAVIPLGAALPLRSCHLPADSASSVVVRLLGVAPDGGRRVSPAFRQKGDSSLWPCSSPL